MPVEISTKQMALTRDLDSGGFMERAQAMLAQVSGQVLSEPGSTPYHPLRAQYAQAVVRSPGMATQQGGPQIVMGINVINTTVYDEATKKSTCSILDLDLQSQIMSLWNALAGIDSPS